MEWEVLPQKWMNFYTKVLSKFASGKGLKIILKIEVAPEGGVSTQKIEETKTALRELGLGMIMYRMNSAVFGNLLAPLGHQDRYHQFMEEPY